MSAAVDQAGIDYHVILAQNALQQCLDMPELQAELICALIKQTSKSSPLPKLGVQVSTQKLLKKSVSVLLIFIFYLLSLSNHGFLSFQNQCVVLGVYYFFSLNYSFALYQFLADSFKLLRKLKIHFIFSF